MTDQKDTPGPKKLLKDRDGFKDIQSDQERALIIDLATPWRENHFKQVVFDMLDIEEIATWIGSMAVKHVRPLQARIAELEAKVETMKKSWILHETTLRHRHKTEINTLTAQVERLRGLLEGAGDYIYTTMPNGKDLQGQRSLFISSIRSALAETEAGK